ncbi:hypothetical protein [Paenibacillus sp. UNC496MF]|uniref:hypothetical protein n=1 Tax=Paenibacillus sp. UNC496MF TaxID=1502753 RepID=UPI001C42F828|nr:hypothetical protein [Paenibacillus sp. UNC496MF]
MVQIGLEGEETLRIQCTEQQITFTASRSDWGLETVSYVFQNHPYQIQFIGSLPPAPIQQERTETAEDGHMDHPIGIAFRALGRELRMIGLMRIRGSWAARSCQ